MSSDADSIPNIGKNVEYGKIDLSYLFDMFFFLLNYEIAHW